MLTRFAPSPTGYLHLGHVVNAIYVWRTARRLGGRVVLRMEDHDRVRCRPEYEAAILEDLEWLGFVPDEGLMPILRQSGRGYVYDSALARLRQVAHVYACDCSRKRVGGEHYDGFCRNRGLAEEGGRGLRVHVEPGPEHFEDLLLGQVEQSPADQCGDILIRDRDGHWTYHFAVAVDDLAQGITHVIRGADLLSSTGRQNRLARLLGRQRVPVFLHHPLVLGASGRKLSKRDRSSGVRDLRRAGMSADDVIRAAAAAVGLAD